MFQSRAVLLRGKWKVSPLQVEIETPTASPPHTVLTACLPFLTASLLLS